MLVNADELVIGWKVVKELPSWVNDAVAWKGFVVDIEDHAAGSRGLPSPEESISDNMSFNSEGSGMERGVVANMEKDLYDKEGDNHEEDEEQDVNEDDEAKDEEEEEQEDSKVGKETDEKEEHMLSDPDDTDEEQCSSKGHEAKQ